MECAGTDIKAAAGSPFTDIFLPSLWNTKAFLFSHLDLNHTCMSTLPKHLVELPVALEQHRAVFLGMDTSNARPGWNGSPRNRHPFS